MTGTQAALIDAMMEVEEQALEGALVSLTELRHAMKAKWKISDERFNQEILQLEKTGKWALHRHAHKSRLTPEEKRQLVPIIYPSGEVDYAIGIALRSENALAWKTTKQVLR